MRANLSGEILVGVILVGRLGVELKAFSWVEGVELKGDLSRGILAGTNPRVELERINSAAE